MPDFSPTVVPTERAVSAERAADYWRTTALVTAEEAAVLLSLRPTQVTYRARKAGMLWPQKYKDWERQWFVSWRWVAEQMHAALKQ